ncbi:pseudaminic acid synthase [Candidatus Babeliales bacterium]|nr:pseudaminic acid synthase [Candidatus Babeliales bacterium]
MVKIDNKKIGRQYKPFIIAEMSGNHNQSLDIALQIVENAAKSGVDAIKLQTYTADTMTLDVQNDDFLIKDPKSLWSGQYLHKLYQQAYTPWEWHEAIFNRCKKLGIIGFSTPFDESAVDFLEKLNVPCYKVASFEINHLPLLKKIAKTNKPIIISTGRSSITDLDEAINAIKSENNNKIILLKCTSSYPADPKDSNILTIPHMRKLFGCQVGLSDHTLGIGVSVASVALGVTVIEKHFTLSRADGGVDSKFSLEPQEMKSLVEESYRAWQALGKINYCFTKSEEKSIQFKRSLYVAQDLKSGDILTKDNLRVIRPGYGLHPRYYGELLGKKVSCDIKKGTPVKWDLVGI